MRITSNAIRQETLAAIRTGMTGLAEAQRRVASGKRVHAASDDPVAADGILRTARRSRALEQYTRNIDTADSRLRAEEGALNGLTNLLSRAKELAVSTATGTAGQAHFEAAKAEVDALLDTAVELSSVRFGNGYLFGGSTPGQAPFTTGGARTAGAEPAGSHEVDIGGSSWFATNHDGARVFEDSKVFEALSGLSDALAQAIGGAGHEVIADAIPTVDEAFGDVQQLLGEVGARTNRLEVARANVEALDLNLRTLRSDLEDADIEQAVTDLLGRQMAYQSALLAASRIMSSTLTDYLR